MDKTTFYKTLTQDYNSGKFNDAHKGYDHLLYLISELGNCIAKGELCYILQEKDNSGIGLDEIVEDFIDKELGDECFGEPAQVIVWETPKDEVKQEQIDAMKKLMEAYNYFSVGDLDCSDTYISKVSSMRKAIKTLSEPMKDSLGGLSV